MTGKAMPEEPDAPRTVLFLCTGNYYRSRFAEALFNYHAEREGLPFRAVSRGLAPDPRHGPISPYAAAALARRGIPLSHTGPRGMAVGEPDLQGAELVVALEDREHRPMVRRDYPHWEDRILYWDISDVDRTPAEEALARIETQVLELLERLRSGA